MAAWRCRVIYAMSLQYQTEDDPSQESQAAAPPQRAPVPVYTIILIVSYALVTAVQFIVGLDRSILLAGFVKQAFIHDHQYWRILTGAALHGGLLHVAM